MPSGPRVYLRPPCWRLCETPDPDGWPPLGDLARAVSPGQIAAAVAAVLIAAGAVWRRRRLSAERLLLAAGAVLALAVYATGLLSELPDPEKVIEDLAEALGPWAYALVGAMAFLETGAFVGLVAPGEFTVVVGGVIAGQGEIDVIVLIGLVWLCCVLGDSTSFLIGQRLGRAFLERHGPRLKITPDRLERVEGYFDRYGGRTILIGRFIGLVRALAPFVAGSSGMRYRRFIPYSIVGTGLWAATFCLLGFFFYRSFEQVTRIAGRATLAFGILVGLIVGAVYVYRRLRHEEERRRLSRWVDRQAERPALRPLAAVARPIWRSALRPAWRLAEPRLRFAWNRLTPGGLGIEFTTTVATAVVGLYVFVAYAVILSRDPGLTPLDRETLDLARELRAEPAVDVLKLVTDLGSLPVVGALTAVAVVLLAYRRRPAELTALVGGAVVIWVTVQLSKAGIDRPRPPGPLIDARNASFPSAHAAYSTAWVALAVIAARVLPGMASRAALVVAAIGVAAAVGLSRLYLHVHYWSDVAAGWALGLGVFGACASVALLVVQVRQNRASAPAYAGEGPARIAEGD